MKNDRKLGIEMDPEILTQLDEMRLLRNPRITRKAALQEAAKVWVRNEKRKLRYAGT